MAKEKKSKFETIIRNGSPDALGVIIYFDLFNKNELDKLTFKQCIGASTCSLFRNKTKSIKIYTLLLEKAKYTSNYIAILKEKNFLEKVPELWNLAKSVAKNSWDYYILYIEADINNPEKEKFFNKIFENIKMFKDFKNIFENDYRKLNSKKFFGIERRVLLELGGNLAKNFNDFIFLTKCYYPEEVEKKHFFKKAKEKISTFTETNELLEVSNSFCIEENEKIEILKLAGKFAETDEHFEKMLNFAKSKKEIKLVKSLLKIKLKEKKLKQKLF